MLAACLLGAGNLRETTVKFQWSSAITRFGRVCVKRVVRISVRIRLRVEVDSLILELIIHGRVNNTLMDYTSGNFSEDLESHCIPNIGGNANPPACFLLGRWEGFVVAQIS